MKSINNNYNSHFQDTIRSGNDTEAGSRPLPQWLQEQKARSELAEEKEDFIQKDHSLYIAIGVTLLTIFLIVALFSVWIMRKKENKI